jgi:hypothetical protein
MDESTFKLYSALEFFFSVMLCNVFL